jgi:hypothetical protein
LATARPSRGTKTNFQRNFLDQPLHGLTTGKLDAARPSFETISPMLRNYDEVPKIVSKDLKWIAFSAATIVLVLGALTVGPK